MDQTTPVRRRRRRRRRKLNPRFFMMVGVLAVLLILLICLLSRCGNDQNPADSTTTSPTETQLPHGWKEENGVRFFLGPDGTRLTGWQDIEGSRYFFDSNGELMTGWLVEGDRKFYLCENGAMARGRVEVDGQVQYFTADGAPIIYVNAENPIPEGYEPILEPLGLAISVEGSLVDTTCYEALVKMLTDCNKEAPTVCVVSSYRTVEQQTKNFNRKVETLKAQGMTEEQAKIEAAKVISVPGTSEHHLGLAVDIVDTRSWNLNEEQENLPGQKWLMNNCWRYGFILRYPVGTEEQTGIIYEPWHYRYVGTELAEELHKSGLTLDEYLKNLKP